MLWKKQPVGSKIADLNSKIGAINANGTQCDTLDAVKTYLLSIHNSLVDGEIKAVHMLFTFSYTGQYFVQNTRYVGYYTRINSATGSVSLTNRTGDIIIVGLSSATSTPVWEFNSINSNANAKYSKLEYKSFNAVTEFDNYPDTVIDSITFTSGGTAVSNLAFTSSATLVIFGTGDYKHVICYRANGETYTRHKNNGTWDTNWEQLALNSKLETYNLGTDTLANIQSAMVSYVSSSMSNFSVKNVRFTPSAATGIFKVYDYIGTIHRIYATRFTVEARNKENDLILGEYENGTWSWQSLNSKIANLNCDTAYAGSINPDNYRVTGAYSVGIAAAYSPTGTIIYGLLVVYNSYDVATQIFYRTDSSSTIYIRNKPNANSSWSSWRTI